MDQWDRGLDETPIPSFVIPASEGSKGRLLAQNLKGVKQFRVLLVAKDPRDISQMTELLPIVGPAPFALEYTDQLWAALKRLAQGGIDVVLLDTSHQRGTGFEGIIKVHAQSPEVPIIVLGDSDDEVLAVKAAQEGAQDFLVKRYLDSNLLVRSIRYAIERTRRRRAQEAIAQTQRETFRQEHLCALGQMACAIAHDFNNSLTPVLGYSEMLLREPELSEKVRASLELIRTAASDAAGLVQRLQEFYRRQGPTELTEKVDLQDLVKQIAELTRPKWRDEAQRTGRLIDMQLEATDVPPVLGNLAEVREVLLNLVINAVDAMPFGGRITLRLGLSEQFLCVEVADTGTGMTNEVRTRCFEPFFTTKGPAGTGLGLSVCHGIIQRHGGRIEFDSELGQGTIFRVYLPLASQSTPSDAEPPEYVLPPGRVLFIDDDPRVRQVVASMLEQLGQQVDVADGGAAGLSMFGGNSYDVVITDMGMPEVNGGEVIHAIKKMRPTIPVVLLTGWGSPFMAQALNKVEEPDRILKKPLALRSLAAALWELRV